MILDDDTVYRMLDEGYDTIPKMTCRMLGIPLSAPGTLSPEMRTEYRRISRQFGDRLNRMLKWHEVEYITLGSNKARIWKRRG